MNYIPLRLRLFGFYLFMAVYALFHPEEAKQVMLDADEAETNRQHKLVLAKYRSGPTVLQPPSGGCTDE